MTEPTISFKQTAHGWRATVTRGDVKLYITPDYETKAGASLAADAFLVELEGYEERREAMEALWETQEDLLRTWRE